MEDPFINIQRWFRNQPIISKVYLAISFMVSVLLTMHLFEINWLLFQPKSIEKLQIYRTFTAMIHSYPLLFYSIPPIEWTVSSIIDCIIALATQFFSSLISGKIFIYPLSLHLVYLAISLSEEHFSKFYQKTEGIIMCLYFWFSLIIYGTFLSEMYIFMPLFTMGVLHVFSSRFPRVTMDCLFFTSLDSKTFFWLYTIFHMVVNVSIKEYVYMYLISYMYLIFRDEGVVHWLKQKFSSAKYIIRGNPNEY